MKTALHYAELFGGELAGGGVTRPAVTRDEAPMVRERRTEPDYEVNQAKLNSRFILFLTLPLGILILWLLFAFARVSTPGNFAFGTGGSNSVLIADSSKPQPVSDASPLDRLHLELKSINLPSVKSSLEPNEAAKRH